MFLSWWCFELPVHSGDMWSGLKPRPRCSLHVWMIIFPYMKGENGHMNKGIFVGKYSRTMEHLGRVNIHNRTFLDSYGKLEGVGMQRLRLRHRWCYMLELPPSKDAGSAPPGWHSILAGGLDPKFKRKMELIPLMVQKSGGPPVGCFWNFVMINYQPQLVIARFLPTVCHVTY